MGLTERIEIRLDEDVLKRVDEWMERTEKASSRSEAIRLLVDLGLNTVTGNAIHLTAGDKLNFTILRDIAKHLKVDTDTDLDFMSSVIYGGHYWAPTWEMQGLFHNSFDRPADVRVVGDILDMWSFIEEAIEGITDEGKEKVKAANMNFLPTFDGFDGNNECELMGIAQFFVEKLNRFQRFKGREFNSHYPVEGRYRRMAKAFDPMRKSLSHRRSLSADQIVELLNAGRD
jgi:uncharacterized protein YfbU (UPF0304 family)/Arc/MetJ-type ribon-helix-helix transcriptional regulator